MPLPFILGGIALLATGLLGGVGHIVANEMNDEAKATISLAEAEHAKICLKLEEKREGTSDLLSDYGRLKLEVNAGSLGKYIDITNRLTANKEMMTNEVLDYKKYRIDENDLLTSKDISDIKISSMNSSEILAGSIASLGSGVLASIGAYSGVTILATASTGTAISTLTGIAASNATMAWLGGGALAAGGAGIAGGAAMLGGIALMPAIFVSAIFAGMKSQENLENAQIFEKKIKAGIALMERAITNLEAVDLRVLEGKRVLTKLDSYLEEKLEEYFRVVNKCIENKAISYTFSEEDRKTILITEVLVKKIFEVLNTPLLDEDGEFTEKFNLVIEENKVEYMLEKLI